MTKSPWTICSKLITVLSWCGCCVFQHVCIAGITCPVSAWSNGGGGAGVGLYCCWHRVAAWCWAEFGLMVCRLTSVKQHCPKIYATFSQLYEMIWNDMKCCEMVWTDMKWYDMIWNDMKCYEMLWNDMKWYEMIWNDIWFLIDEIWLKLINQQPRSMQRSEPPVFWCILWSYRHHISGPLVISWG